jgi:hypothetical protein
MNDRLKTIVDLDKYPIHDLNSPIIKKLIEKCKKELEEDSCSTISNFILPEVFKDNDFRIRKTT